MTNLQQFQIDETQLSVVNKDGHAIRHIKNPTENVVKLHNLLWDIQN